MLRVDEQCIKISAEVTGGVPFPDHSYGWIYREYFRNVNAGEP
jgi:hypothetical protein